MKTRLIILIVLSFVITLLSQEISYNQEFQVNTSKDGWSPSIAALSDGRFVVCWGSSQDYDGADYGIYAQIFDSKANKQGYHFPVNTYTKYSQTDPHIAVLTNGRFVICWESQEQDGEDGGIFAQMFYADGKPAGEEFQVNSYIKNNQWHSSIVALSDGGFVICWESYDDQDGTGSEICAQLFDSNASRIGDEFQVNTYTDNTLMNPSISCLSDGAFVICWESSGQDGSGWGVYAQMFHADGKRMGDEFRVNTYTNNNQNQQVITALEDGGFVISWSSLYQDGSCDGVFAQMYHVDGTRKGEEFQVNTYTYNYQANPYISSLSSGGFIVCWESYGQGGPFTEIYAQMFNTDGSQKGNEFHINTNTNQFQMGPCIARLSDGKIVITWESSHVESIFQVYAKYFPAEPIVHQLGYYQLITPANDKTLQSTWPTFSWQKSSNVRICYPWEIEYDLYLSTDEQFSDPFICSGILDTTYTIPDTESLQAGQTYFWKVLAKNIAGDSLWSSNTNAFFVSHTATEVEEDDAQLPTGFELEQNYPNPFNPETTVRYSLPQAGVVELKLYDITGREVMSLVNEWQSAGTHSVKVDGRSLASGVYVYTLTAGSYRESKKMALIK